MTNILFETERLECRRWQQEDLMAIYAIYSDDEGSRWVDDGNPISLDETRQWMRITLNNYDTRGYGMFALFEKASQQLVGCCGLVHPGNQPEAEIKYAFLKTHWGLGLASEIVPKMLDYGAQQFALSHIIATVAEQNSASIRVLEKSGMSYSRQIENDEDATLVYVISS